MNLRSFPLRSTRHNEESGAILILSILFLTVMVVACALAIDLGFQGQDRRTDQKVADLAALDAARALDDQNPCNDPAALAAHVVQAAQDSATRNGFNPNNVTVETGNPDAQNNFVPNANACQSTAVRVTTASVTAYRFIPGSQTQHEEAVATQKPGQGTQPESGEFTMGSFLGSVSTDDAKILDRLLCRAVRGPAAAVCSSVNNSYLNLDAVSWQGLMAGSTSLQALQQQLVADGVDVGTKDKFMNNNITLAQLYTAYAEVLNNQGGIGKAQAAGPMTSLAGQTDGTTSVQMGKFISLDQGQGDNALSTQFNAFRLVTGSALAANGSNFLTVPDLGINVPNTSKTSVSLQLIEKPVNVEGPVGTSATTAQADLTVTPTLNKVLSIAGLSSATLTGDFPVHITGGGAKGTMADQNCASSPGLSALIDPQPFTTGLSGTLTVNGTLISVPLLGSPQLTATVPVSGSQTTDGQSGTAPFAYTAEFEPNQVYKRVGSSTLGLNTTAAAAGNVTFTVGSGIAANLISSATTGALPGVLSDLDTMVVSRISRLLGVSIGGADVNADWLQCNGQIGVIGLPIPALIK